MSSHNIRRVHVRALYLLALFILTLASLVLPPGPLVMAQSGLPIQTFDGNSTPAGWNVVNNQGDAGWRFDNPAQRPSDFGGSANYAIADSDNAGRVAMDTELRTPTLSFAGASGVKLSFKTYFEPYEQSVADVDLSVDGGQTWINVWRQTAKFVGQVNLNLNQAANQGEVVVRFHYYQANYSWFWKIDDVQIDALAVPSAPGQFSATPQSSQATLSWTAPGGQTSYKLETATSASGPFTLLATLNGSATSFVLNNIACGVGYFLRLRAVNGAGESPNATTTLTTTPCPQLTSLNETFSDQELPNGWSVQNNGQPGAWAFNDPGQRGAWLNLGQNFFAIADSYAASDATFNSELRSPALNLSDRLAVTLSFRTFFFNVNNSVADVDVSADGGQTWANVWRQTTNLNFNPPRQITLDISAQAANKASVVVRFHYTGITSGLWLIDDVSVAGLGQPAAPTNLGVRAGANGALSLSWSGDAPQYEIQRSPNGSSGWDKLTDVSGAMSYVDSSVASNTEYFYRVFARNSAGASAQPSNVANGRSGDRSSVTIDVTVSYYDSAANAAAKRVAIENNLRFLADALYEMSNGVVKLGRVTFYTDGALADRANIVWVKECWPNAHIAGYNRAASGLRVQHCDIFSNGGNPINYVANTQQSWIQGGYTLGHEFGHYYFSVYDEYKGSNACGANIGSPCVNDSPVSFSIMNSHWQAVGGDNRWLNFSTPLNDTRNTANFRVFGASAWNTLVRLPAQDPRDGQRSTSPTRIYIPQLANVAPAAGQAPSIELPGAQAAARSALQFAWPGSPAVTGVQGIAVENGLARQIVIERSSRLSVADFEAIKAAAIQLVDRARIGDALGVITYDSAASEIISPTQIADETIRTSLRSAISGITQGTNGGVVGSALQQALAALNQAGVPTDTAGAVYLFTAGLETGGTPAFDAAAAFEAAYVPIYTFGLNAGAEADATLDQLATQTGGAYYSVGGPEALKNAVIDADQEATPLVAIDIDSGARAIESTPSEIPFLVDSSLGTIYVELGYFGEPLSLTLTLLQPDGTPSATTFFSNTASSGFDQDLVTYVSAQVDSPISGTWKLRLSSTGEPLDVFYWIGGTAASGKVPIFADLVSLSGEEISYPNPILLEASVGREFPISDAVISGTIEAPDGSISGLTLRDDGAAPDSLAEDGYYAALVDYSGDGDYLIRVTFDNRNGTAKFSEQAVAPATTSDGKVRPAQTYPVGENFQRVAELSVSVSGSAEDDHSDQPEAATPLSTDNSSVPGRIDAAGDIDTFSFEVPNNYQGELILRVDGLGFGMDPYAFVYAFDSQGELSLGFESFLDTVPTSDDYLSISIPATPGQTIYVDLSHFDEEAQTGVYQVSVGPALAADPALGAAKPDRVIHLPVILH